MPSRFFFEGIKAADPDGTPAEISKEGGVVFLSYLHPLYSRTKKKKKKSFPQITGIL